MLKFFFYSPLFAKWINTSNTKQSLLKGAVRSCENIGLPFLFIFVLGEVVFVSVLGYKKSQNRSVQMQNNACIWTLLQFLLHVGQNQIYGYNKNKVWRITTENIKGLEIPTIPNNTKLE